MQTPFRFVISCRLSSTVPTGVCWFVSVVVSLLLSNLGVKGLGFRVVSRGRIILLCIRLIVLNWWVLPSATAAFVLAASIRRLRRGRTVVLRRNVLGEVARLVAWTWTCFDTFRRISRSLFWLRLVSRHPDWCCSVAICVLASIRIRLGGTGYCRLGWCRLIWVTDRFVRRGLRLWCMALILGSLGTLFLLAVRRCV